MNNCIQCGDEYISRQRNQRSVAQYVRTHGIRRSVAVASSYSEARFISAVRQSKPPRTPADMRRWARSIWGGPLPAPEWTRDPTGQEPPIAGNGLSMGIALGGEGRRR